MLRQIATALRYAAEGSPGQEETWDLVAFVVLCLRDIEETVQQATDAWERRDYWVKADRYRQSWSWVSKSARRLDEALAAADIERALAASLDLAQSMQGAKPYKSKTKRPWLGAHRAWRDGDGQNGREQFAPNRGPDDEGNDV